MKQALLKKAKTENNDRESFGQRLRQIRQDRGFSQEQLGRELDISQRMIAFYETQAQKAPAHHLSKMADVLQVSIDELVGHKSFNETAGKRNSRIWHKLRQVETLPAKDRKQVIQLIDTLVEKEKLIKRK